MAILVETLAVIYRNQSGEEPLRIPKIALGPRAEPVRDRRPVRNNDFVLGIDDRSKLLLAYTKGSRTPGWHCNPEDYIIRVVGKDRLAAALHGSIKSNGNDNQSISIYKTHPEDINALGGIEGVKEASSTRPWEIGRFTPEQFVTDTLAQRLLYTLDATRLEIVFALPSQKVYPIPNGDINTCNVVQAAINFRIAGD